MPLTLITTDEESNWKRGIEDLRGIVRNFRGDYAVLAAKATIGYKTIAHFASGKTTYLRSDTVVNLCLALGVSQDKLFGDPVEPVYAAPKVVEYVPRREQRSKGRIPRRELRRLQREARAR